MNKLGLNMIVKNEEHVIERVLNSVAKLVDWYTIVDTGSTDNTKKLIKETMDKHGIPGEILDHEWVNFCTARNFALENLKRKAEWGFWIDADEEVIYENFNKEYLLNYLKKSKQDIVGCMVSYGNSQYPRGQFFRIDSDLEWEGAVHEILLDKNKKGMLQAPNGMYTLVRQDGNSWGDLNNEKIIKKYKEHAELLEEYIKENHNSRWVFYLAQSYRDCGDTLNAIHFYEKRRDMEDGYWEERYVSQLNIADLKRKAGCPLEEVIDAFAECSKYDINRCEHLIPIIRYYQKKQNWPMAYAVGNYAMSNCSKYPYPKSSLFLDKSIYDWKLLDLHTISVSKMNKKYELAGCIKEINKLIQENIIPVNEHSRLLQNNEIHKKIIGFIRV